MSENHATRWLSAAIGLGGAGMEAQASRRLLTLAVAAIEADEGSLLLWDEEIGELRFVATVGNAESEAALKGQRVPLGKGITGLAAATREVQIGAPTYKDVRQTERLSAGPEAVVAAPLIATERVLGVMTGVSFRAGRRFGSKEATVYGEHAAVMAALLDQARRLAALAALGDEDGPAAAGRVAIERQIVERLARLAAERGEALGAVARLLEAVEALIARGRH